MGAIVRTVDATYWLFGVNLFHVLDVDRVCSPRRKPEQLAINVTVASSFVHIFMVFLT
jgi:hypothetical protein